jgi:hypothetical protein
MKEVQKRMICYDCKKMEGCWIWREAIIVGEDGVDSCEEFSPTNHFCRIKHMSLDEMAEFLMNVNNAYAMDCMCGMSECKHPDIDDNCAICFKEYLESEVQEE